MAEIYRIPPFLGSRLSTSPCKPLCCPVRRAPQCAALHRASSQKLGPSCGVTERYIVMCYVNHFGAKLLRSRPPSRCPLLEITGQCLAITNRAPLRADVLPSWKGRGASPSTRVSLPEGSFIGLLGVIGEGRESKKINPKCCFPCFLPWCRVHPNRGVPRMAVKFSWCLVRTRACFRCNGPKTNSGAGVDVRQDGRR
ncbi:hypothetical protein BGZ61DRAFT_129714 [Ilyonectria robusta]|uniref:uncharacterized protein n=1 Tax=Ilyonectria robusta TaxID=1079257 RepID=UPI001E8D225C|nr:uncharacterized protein BGZ61DRAFT_129714 [Ilyonectria robusta]KAH8734785.1 hypothetical protein BGZ61DRAFT_129714 [Ilyonectria robusta]